MDNFFNEFEIVNRFGDTRRIDRLIIKPDAIWIMDYKLGRDRVELDRKQVQEYKALMSEIHPGKTVKGFLVYLGDNVDVVEV